MKFTQQSVDTFGFPMRALKAIRHQGITNISQLCLLDGMEIIRWRKNGEEALLEILQALLKRNIRPLWLKTVAAECKRPSELKAPDGWTRMPCSALRCAWHSSPASSHTPSNGW